MYSNTRSLHIRNYRLVEPRIWRLRRGSVLGVMYQRKLRPAMSARAIDARAPADMPLDLKVGHSDLHNGVQELDICSLPANCCSRTKYSNLVTSRSKVEVAD